MISKRKPLYCAGITLAALCILTGCKGGGGSSGDDSSAEQAAGSSTGTATDTTKRSAVWDDGAWGDVTWQ